MNKRLVLIDGHHILHRAYHAFPPTLTTRKGELVNAVYGFTRILLKVIADLQPKYLAVTFDRMEPTFRHKEFIGYQVQRPKMDAELADQIGRVHQIAQALNIPIFEKPGFEADDLIGTLSVQAVKKKVETIIVTGDRDIMQLVDKKVRLYLPQKGFSEALLCGEKEVKEILGIKPIQVIDYKALVGDSSDNYPGVSGIGPKTAVKLLLEYGDLDNIYRHLKDLPDKVASKLTGGQESAKLSQKLATIVTNAPVKLDLPACLVADYNQDKAIKLFQELEFRSMINKLPGVKFEKEDLPAGKAGKKKESEQIKLL